MSKETNKKYTILENETLEHHGKTLYRIQAVKDFAVVKAGDKGGWIENENNLSQEGDCWVHNEAKVYDNARVYGNAQIYNEAQIYDEAKIEQYARVGNSAHVYGCAVISQYALVHENARVSENGRVYGKAELYGNAHVFGYAHVFGFVEISGYAHISGNAHVKEKNDYAVFKNNWSSCCYFTYTKSNKMWEIGSSLCHEQLIEYGYKESELSGKMYETYVNLVKEQEKIEEKLSKS